MLSDELSGPGDPLRRAPVTDPSRAGAAPRPSASSLSIQGKGRISLAVVITKPGLATVRLGPFAGDVQAERAAGD